MNTETNSPLNDAIDLLRRWVEVVYTAQGDQVAIYAALSYLAHKSKEFIAEHEKETETPAH